MLEITDDVEMKSHVYAAMGMLAVKCGDTETAKTAFFQWYMTQLKISFVVLYGLIAIPLCMSNVHT